METIGRREAHKRETRAAIERAARELFTARGFDAVTVREIAQAAGVTERTFYRYYPGKHDLVASDALAWAEALRGAIRGRPAPEPPLQAVERAIVGLSRAAVDQPEKVPVWLLNRRPRPFGVLGQSDPRALIRFEEAIAGALRDRAGESECEDCDLLARVCVAVIRTAAIRRQALVLQDLPADPPALLAEQFKRLVELTGLEARPTQAYTGSR